MEYLRRRDTVTALLKGELDQCSAQAVRSELDDLISDRRIRHLILDMKELTFMDSSGIGVILGRYRTLAQRGGTVSVTHMNAQIARVFALSGMGQIIGVI